MLNYSSDEEEEFMQDVASVLKEFSVSFRCTGIEYQLIRSFENETPKLSHIGVKVLLIIQGMG